jgi:saccharopine dehydrogenase-like NADP-dependent oxidoreductase
LEEVDFPSVGKLEAFYTDGLRNLLDTIRNVDEMWEKTLRYPGHAKKIGLLRALGFFEEKQVDVEGVRLSPRKLTAKLFQTTLWRPEIEDVVALKVEVSGIKRDKQTRYIYHLVDRYDKKRGTTAMARTTAYPASIVAQLILKKAIKGKGVVPPELLGMDEDVFRKFYSELEKRKVKVTEEVSA